MHIKRFFGIEVISARDQNCRQQGKARRPVSRCSKTASLEEYTIERAESDNMVGSIFKGKVRNIEQGLKAMFVDIGFEKNAFLHYWDAIPAALDEEMETIERGGQAGPASRRSPSKDIPEHLSGRIGSHGAGDEGADRQQGSAGHHEHLARRAVHGAHAAQRPVRHLAARSRTRRSGCGCSRIMEKLSVPEGMGIILRTAAQGKRARYFVRDLAMLVEQWNQIEQNNETQGRPGLRLLGTRPRRAHRARFPHRGGRRGPLRRCRRPPSA